MTMERASSQLHTNTSQRKQFQVRITFEDEHVFTRGPSVIQEYQEKVGKRALKAKLTLGEFTGLKNKVEAEMGDLTRSPEQTNITSYVHTVFSIITRFIETSVRPEKERLGFDLKVQLWHLKGERDGVRGRFDNNGASQHSNSMRSTCSVRVWCIDTDGLDPSPELLNQAVETNVDPMHYLLNANTTQKMMKSWIFEPQHLRSNYDLPATWQCPEHQTKGVEHVVIFNRPNLEGITRCGQKESFAKMLDSWKSKQAKHLQNDRYRADQFVTQFGLKPCFMINDASVSGAIKEFNYPVSAVGKVTKLFKIASESSDSALPLIGLALNADDFCSLFEIPHSIGQHIIAGGVCAVKQDSKFKHLPSTKTAYDEQTLAHSLAVRNVNIRFSKKTGKKKYQVRSVWREEPNLSPS
jgi:hypothetical protein